MASLPSHYGAVGAGPGVSHGLLFDAALLLLGGALLYGALWCLVRGANGFFELIDRLAQRRRDKKYGLTRR